MIKKGKNTIYCGDCKAEIKQTKDLIETKHINGGIQLRFFRCKACGVKTLIDVTDKEVREKVIELRKWADQKKKALDTVIDEMSEEELKKLTMLADECQFNMDKLQGEIKEAKAELKIKYEGEL